MQAKHLIIAIILLITSTLSYSQESATEQQYKAAMQNAKTAFDAKMYSEALYFYREALKIKPDAKLPRYKIEDIRTIYIDDGIKEIAGNKQIAQEEAQKQAEAKADERIEAEIEQAQKEIETLRVAAVINIEEETSVYDENIDIADVVPTLKTKLPEPEPEPEPEPVPVPEITEPEPVEPAKEEPKPIVEPVKEEPKPVVEQPEKKEVKPEPKPTPKPEPAKPVAKPANKPVSQPKAMTEEEKKAHIEAEKQKLRMQYPEQKTVLEIDLPGKHITRVIMNVNNEIHIYLKVKHSWGAVFFFEEEVGEDMRSITELTFNKMTDLRNYGH
ncbi:MAG: hypothetical protein J6T98_06555 [Salinivirgaceae bacterium]|nr:hypothetical protein [Salinivirgaceae bacterium]